ncbi:zinc-binding dehydrogenase [Fictibacillus sp. BK138]|uniref:zinc-binding dehydrogenase n=1 Tax=Fictibacillus sp. BK138 TaxID=2512121 RepID=UPI001028816C|nr:zinc-binding dehydrogenase [Fictibacillus sp. BK138]RZT21719.1 NADPH:quinone reductase-like Zn-dependent oxidoreductase [Fictibacillus sp. BK138]
MKALLLEDKNMWREMKVSETEKPAPGPGEVLVKVKAAGLNPVDYKTATNGNPNWSYPHILGVDAAGVIEEIGESVTGFQKGDRVFYHGNLTKKGGFAEFAVTTAHTVAKMPDELSFEEAAALPCAGMTAYQALIRKMNLQTGETILIHGGAGGVGGFAIQLAKNIGAKVITTCSPENEEYVKELGADDAIFYKTEDVHARILEITENTGVDAVLDTVSRDNATQSLKSIAFNGRIAFIAGNPDYSAVKPFSQALSFHEIALGAAHFSNNREAQKDLATMNEELAKLVVEGKISTMISEKVTLEKVPAALIKLSERHVKGKIVAVI